MERFHVTATGHSLNYLPNYVAAAQDYFEEEGLAVSETVPSPWDRVLDHIGEGSAEAALGGIWVPSMFHGRGRRLVPFAQVSNRAPLALVGREDPEGFDLTRLIGCTVSMKGSNGASVGMYLKMLLREAGIDPKAVNYIQDLDAGILKSCFVGGMGDYLLIDLPGALAMERAESGRVMVKFAESGGAIPWSVYYTDGEADPSDSRPARFARALGRGMDWINARPAGDFADFLAETYPAILPEISVEVVDLYRAVGMWTSPRIGVDSYGRWQTGIADAHLTDGPIAYDDLIDGGPTAPFAQGEVA